MTHEIVGTSVSLRLFAPGDDSFSMCATGTIVERLPTLGRIPFHDGYRLTLTDAIEIEGVEIREVSVCPSGSYPFEPGGDKMLDVLSGSIYVTVSWRLPDGAGYTYGEKGTFAEVTLIQ
jgi:hypothetical protein